MRVLAACLSVLLLSACAANGELKIPEDWISVVEGSGPPAAEPMKLAHCWRP